MVPIGPMRGASNVASTPRSTVAAGSPAASPILDESFIAFRKRRLTAGIVSSGLISRGLGLISPECFRDQWPR